jgi:hypothetical protein
VLHKCRNLLLPNFYLGAELPRYNAGSIDTQRSGVGSAAAGGGGGAAMVAPLF